MKKVEFIFKIVIVIFAGLYASLLFIEYDRFSKGKDMLLPIKNTDIHVYNDGVVEINTGLGYKTIRYDRDSVKGEEFGTIFLSEKNNKELND